MTTTEIVIILSSYAISLIAIFIIGHRRGQLKVLKELQKEIEQFEHIRKFNSFMEKVSGKNEK